jgi:hypothetical protein
MRQATNSGERDWATALRSHVLLVLFAILALGATPLGAGELLAAETYVYERSKGEARAGDLPTRFAVPAAEMCIGEYVPHPHEVASASPLIDDTPCLPSVGALALEAEPSLRSLPILRDGIPPSLASAFAARAPPAV